VSIPIRHALEEGLVEKAEPIRKIAPTALVTGATGFIGSHLVRALCDRGYRVKIYSRHEYQDDPRFRVREEDWICGELTDGEKFKLACKGVEIVFHLAGAAHSGSKDSNEVFRTNVAGSQSILEASIAGSVRTLIFFSSILAAQNEKSLYAESKKRAEGLFLTNPAYPGSNTKVIVLRPAGVYGPGMRGNIRTFIRMIRRGLLFNFSDVNGTFPLVSINDLCLVAIDAAEREWTNPYPEIFSVTDSEKYTPCRLQSAVCQCLNRKNTWLRVPQSMLLVGAFLAQAVNDLGLIRNQLGLSLYRNLYGKRTFNAIDRAFDYPLPPTTSLESEMHRIIDSIDL